MVLRKSTRTRRPAIQDDYHLYFTVEETDLGDEDDPRSVPEAMQSMNSEKWKFAMEDELKSMSQMGV